jgi:hypothetical protein
MKSSSLDKNGIWVTTDNETPSYPNDGNEKAFYIEDNSFWFKHRNNIIKYIMQKIPAIGNFADIGGGNGYQIKFISENFKSKKVFLIELGYKGCLNAKTRGVENVYNMPFQSFDFNGNNVNSVGLFDVLEHIENDVDFIKDLANSLPKDSLIYLTVPAHQYLWSSADYMGGHFRRYDSKSISKLAIESNTELAYFSYFFNYIPPITFLLKRIPYLLFKDKDINKLLEKETENLVVSEFTECILNRFHNYELKKIQHRPIKIGGSCIFVLRTK